MFASLLVALVFFVTSVVEMHGRIIGVGKEEAFLFILCPFCLRNRSDGVKAINYLIGVSLTKWDAYLLVKWGQLENGR